MTKKKKKMQSKISLTNNFRSIQKYLLIEFRIKINKITNCANCTDDDMGNVKDFDNQTNIQTMTI